MLCQCFYHICRVWGFDVKLLTVFLLYVRGILRDYLESLICSQADTCSVTYCISGTSSTGQTEDDGVQLYILLPFINSTPHLMHLNNSIWISRGLMQRIKLPTGTTHALWHAVECIAVKHWHSLPNESTAGKMFQLTAKPVTRFASVITNIFRF